MLASNGSVAVFWSNGLVGPICGLAILMLLWPLIAKTIAVARGGGKPVTTPSA